MNVAQGSIDNDKNYDCSKAATTEFFCAIACYQAPYKFVHCYDF